MTTTTDRTSPALQRALERLQAGVTQLMTGPGWQAALNMRAQLHTYSFLNTSLILAQRPDSTAVAGYRKWQELGRQVRKGERGISILAPLLKKDPDDPDQRTLYGFRSVHVFDITQTDGPPLPEHPQPQRLEGDSPAIQAALRTLGAFASSEGLTLRHDLDHPHALGAYYHHTRQIRLKADLPALQQLKTLIHELAHALLHNPATDQRDLAELEAESTAYLVCHQLHLDTSAYSFAYLANWAPNLNTLLASGERAARTADHILHAITTSVPAPTPTDSAGAGPSPAPAPPALPPIPAFGGPAQRAGHA